MTKEIKIAEKLTVTFDKRRILPSGEIGSMTITQLGLGSEIQEILLTPEQARSLSNVIRTKYGVDGQ